RAIFAILPPPTPLRYPLSLHDALPISLRPPLAIDHDVTAASHHSTVLRPDSPHDDAPHESPECDGSATDQGWQSEPPLPVPWPRSEEHTSELQSRENLVCRLLLEKKKK